MKRILCILLTVLLLTACGSTTPETPSTTTAETTSESAQSPTAEITENTETTEATEPTESSEPLPFDLEELRQNLPRMDGSTSLIPLEASIRAALFGKSIEEATKDVAHSTTWGSFYNLLEGSVDMIFSCNLSEIQLEQAQYENVELELVPIAREGFIFVVNADNPVDSLTQQQLRDIYTGKITNWKEVGGLDEEIIAYQRNNTSGSQNYMSAFMEGYDLMDAPIELRPDSMAGLLDVLAVNDNSRASIGYSVYAYAANMYGNGNEIKFLKIDSVAPSKATFASGEYPLLGENFAVFRADEPADSPVRKLVQWCQSYDGQLAIARAGYVTMRDIGFDYEEMQLQKYEGIGTGPVPSDTPAIIYTMSTDSLDVATDVVNLSGGVQSYRLFCLTNNSLSDEISSFIDEQMMSWAWDAAKTIQARIDILNGGSEYREYEMGIWDCNLTKLPVSVDLRCSNGYFSVAVSVGYTWAVQEGTSHYYRTETATWDLLSGSRLSQEDLFCRGVDVDAVLTDYLQNASQRPLKTYGSTLPEMKCDFGGLPAKGWHLTHEGIYFDEDNPYFSRGYYFDLRLLPAGTLSAQQARDFSSALKENSGIQCGAELNITGAEFYYAYNQDEYVSCSFLNEDRYSTGAKINAQVMDYLNRYYTEEVIRQEFAAQTTQEPDMWFMDWYAYCIAERYILFSGSTPQCYLGDDNWLRYSKEAYLLFDMESGEQVDTGVLLKEGWQDAITTIDPPYGVSHELLDLQSAIRIQLIPYSTNELSLLVTDQHGDWWLGVPMSYLSFS